METNDITDNNIIIKTEEDKNACLRFLTINNNNLSDEYINSIVEYSDCLIYFLNQENHVGFALVKFKSKKKGKILDILLASAIPNMNTLLSQSLYNFAVTHKYSFIYVSPRTPELRKTFIEYGFESIHGIEGVDELLEKEIEVSRIHAGGNITEKTPVRILGAISLDNEFTREYVSSMKEFHKTFIIEERKL